MENHLNCLHLLDIRRFSGRKKVFKLVRLAGGKHFHFLKLSAAAKNLSAVKLPRKTESLE